MNEFSGSLVGTPVFNAAALARTAMGDESLQIDLLKSFLRSAPGMRADLLQAVISSAQLRECVHRLKGSCHFAAADRMVEVLTAHELALRKEVSERTRRKIMRSILPELDLLVRVLVSEIARRCPT